MQIRIHVIATPMRIGNRAFKFEKYDCIRSAVQFVLKIHGKDICFFANEDCIPGR